MRTCQNQGTHNLHRQNSLHPEDEFACEGILDYYVLCLDTMDQNWLDFIDLSLHLETQWSYIGLNRMFCESFCLAVVRICINSS
jgi:hypothetical protein